MSGEGKQPAALGPGLAPFLDSTRIGTGHLEGTLCLLPSDILSYERVHDLIVKPIEIRDSYAFPSTLPGLGVELDEDAVRRYRVT
jgi:L-alanine-DL-glutamate epimerase-like enolase superfamily enzyme